MKTLNIQGNTYLVLTNGSMVKMQTPIIKRIHVLEKDMYTETYWNPLQSEKKLDWKDSWAKYDWISDHSL